MKPVVYAPAALDSFDDILEYTADTFGEAQALTYTEQLVARIEALAPGAGPARCRAPVQEDGSSL